MGGPDSEGWRPATGEVVAGKFILQRALGAGGMGAVWLAYHKTLKIPCALKFLHPRVADSAAHRARFEREAVAAARLRSPHVVHLLDHGVWEGAPYIAMELLEGEDLAHRLHRVGTLSPRDTVAVIGQAARALTRAHGSGLVHRDLKPANLFLVRDDDREMVKVLDFGVAKLDAEDSDPLTKTGSLLGTPHYMSPEQAQGAKDVDHRSDLWSLAVVAFQCLTGELPFHAEAMGEIFVRIIIRPMPIPSQVAALPPGFDAWWKKAAARDREARFQSARELWEALAAALDISMDEAAAHQLRPPAVPAVAPAARAAAATQPGSTAPGSESAPAPPQRGRALGGVTSTLAASAASAPAPRRRPLPRIALASAALVAATLGWRAAGSRATTAPPAPAAPPSAEAPPIPSTATSTSSAPAVTASAESAPPAASSAAPPAVKGAASAAPRPPAPVKAPPASQSCDPPYEVDANGHRHMKRHCL